MALRKPDVTIFADASYDHRARVAGWGAWIKADGRSSITCGAAMKGPVASATEAELCALANALTVARLRGVLSGRCVVMMQSDCLVALAILRSKIPDVEDRPAPGGLGVDPIKRMKLTKVHLAAVDVVREIVTALGISIVTRHVRAHQPGGGRQWVNAAVDQIARRAMRHRRGKVASPAPLPGD